MIRTTSYDIIVAGLGGQGVNTLTRILFELAHVEGRRCHGAIFKGGAQKAGTIHSELRIFPPARGDDHARHSNQILEGSLDLMLGLEPHEALRFAAFFNDDTRLIINDAPVPFYSERSTGRRAIDAVAELRRRQRHVVARDFSGTARREHGDRRMANVLMLLEAVGAEDFPFTMESVEGVLRSRIIPGREPIHGREGT